MQFTNTFRVESPMSKNRSQVSEVISARDVAEVPAAVTETVATKPKSIRALVMGMILAGKPTKEIAGQIAVHFPGTAADRKSTKHIAWYRSRMKKDGLLPKAEAATPTPAPVIDTATAS